MEPVITIALSRTRYDCGIASLATFLRLPYDEVEAAIKAVTGHGGNKGLYMFEMERAAAKLGFKLERLTRSKYDKWTAHGIISLREKEWWHFAVLYNGMLFDTNGFVWSLEDYLDAYPNVRLGCLLTLSR